MSIFRLEFLSGADGQGKVVSWWDWERLEVGRGWGSGGAVDVRGRKERIGV